MASENKQITVIETNSKTLSGESLLDILEKAYVFSITDESAKDPDRPFMVGEECDRVFYVQLTKDQLIALGNEIIAFAERRS